MIKWKSLALGQMATNCYLLWDEESKESLLIDPADDGEYISQEIEDMHLIPQGILLTHGHFDHILGALTLKLIYKIPVYANNSDDFLLKDASKSASYWLKQKIIVPKLIIDIDLDKQSSIKFGKSEIEIIKTPGHTPGSVCFYLPKERLLFTGDTLFYHLRGRTDLSYSSTKDIFTSLDILFNLPGKTVVLSGHGQETTIEEEKKFRMK